MRAQGFIRGVHRGGAVQVPLPWLVGAAVVLVAAVTTVALRTAPHGRTVLDPPLPTGRDRGLVDAPGSVPDGPADAAGRASPDASSASPAAAPAVPAAPPTANPPGTARPGGNPPAAGRAPVAPRFTAVVGESCPQTAGAGYFASGWFRDWYAKSTGGWTGDGCAGRMVAVPMSGSTTQDDPDNVIVWWFRPPAGATCAVSVYVPGTGDVRDSDGAPATYFVYGSDNASGRPVGGFTVDQVHNQGRWVSTGRFPTGGELSVRMVTRGIDWGPGRQGAHLGVSALKLTC